MRKIIAAVFISLLISCSDYNSKCAFTSYELQKRYSPLVFGTKMLNGQILEFRDKGKDSVTGGYYIFYPNKNLKSYQFFTDMHTYVYAEQYDSAGNITKIEGNPTVLNTAQLINDDSLLIKLYLFSLNKNYTKINITTNDGRILNPKPFNDSLYSNMKSVYFSYNHLKDQRNLTSYISAQYEDRCTREKKNFKDSIVLYYKP
jgi:hypothetical protein